MPNNNRENLPTWAELTTDTDGITLAAAQLQQQIRDIQRMQDGTYNTIAPNVRATNPKRFINELEMNAARVSNEIENAIYARRAPTEDLGRRPNFRTTRNGRAAMIRGVVREFDIAPH